MPEEEVTTSEENPRRILVVEDDHDMNDVMCEMLGTAGYETDSAYGGEQALDMARTGRYDLVLLDLMLPDISGDEVCGRLSEDEKTKSLPVIIVSARRDLPTRLSAFLLGARRYISKPFSSRDLLEFVKIEIKRSEAAHDRRQAFGPTG